MVNRALLWFARVGVAAGAFALLVWIGHLPIGSAEQEGLLRLAWRKSGAQVRICTERSEEELLRLPAHMRQRADCVEHVVPYRLALTLDGSPRIDRLVFPRGAKGDRPIYVQEDLRIAPGAYAVTVEFAPVIPALAARGDDEEENEDGNSDEDGDRDGDRDESEHLRDAIAATPRYRLERTIRAVAGRITLIELDESTREFVVHGP